MIILSNNFLFSVMSLKNQDDIDEDQNKLTTAMISDPKFDRRRTRLMQYRNESNFIPKAGKIINIKSYLSGIKNTEIDSFLPKIHHNTIVCRGNILLSVPVSHPNTELTPKFSRKTYVKLPPIKTDSEKHEDDT